MLLYIIIDTKVSEKLSELISNTALLKDLTRLSPFYQTSSLESFHSVIIHYAPKSTALSYQGMKCRYKTYTATEYTCTLFRLQIAALHFNENVNRSQAVTKDGADRYDVVYPKYKKGGYIVRKVTVAPTYSKLLCDQQY